MTTTLLLEIFAGFFTAFVALWMIALNRPREVDVVGPSTSQPSFGRPPMAALRQGLEHYFLRASAGDKLCQAQAQENTRAMGLLGRMIRLQAGL